MNVVGHEREGVYVACESVREFGEAEKVKVVVHCRVEASGTIVSALDDVHRDVLAR
jgi:hypothetical protein